MKNIIKLVLSLFVLFFLFLAILGLKNLKKPYFNAAKKMPYVVEEMAPDGSSIATHKGMSDQITPYLIAREIDAKPYELDHFESFPNISMGLPASIKMHRTPTITVIDGKKKREYKSWAKSVDVLLKEQRVTEIGVDDKINFALSTEVQDGMQIKISRVAKTTIIVKEAVTFKTTKKSNPEMEKGYKKVLQKGANGNKDKYYLVTRQDGEEVSRVLQKSEVTAEPTEEIVEVGTKVVLYGSGTATWYKRIDTMVAAHNSLPKGTKVKVINVSNGKSVVVTIDDRGIKGNAIIDLSDDAFAALASLGSGVINVRLEKYYPE